MGNDFEVWLVATEYDGTKEPYEMVGGASTRELAEAIRDATIANGFEAVIIERI